MLREVEDARGNVIMFIDELHTVIGARRRRGSSDAANLLKPALARGALRCVGATTLDEYRKYIEKDAALERRFQPVLIGEPTVEDTIAILRGLKPRYEAHHKGVKIKDSALVAAANLSHRYIADRFLPDKAIDLMDEAMSRLAMELESVPTEIDAVQRRLVQLELAQRQLAEENEEHAREHLAEVEKEIQDLRNRLDGLRAQWEKEKSGLGDVHQVRKRLAEVDPEYKLLEAGIREKTARGELPPEEDYQRLRQLDVEKKALAGQLERMELKEPSNGVRRLLRQEVGPEEIAEVVSAWTGIPVTRMMEPSAQAAGPRRADPPAPSSARTRRSRRSPTPSAAAAPRPARPQAADQIVSLPRPDRRRQDGTLQGLGRGHVDAEDAMIRLDMSEFMERHTVAA